MHQLWVTSCTSPFHRVQHIPCYAGAALAISAHLHSPFAAARRAPGEVLAGRTIVGSCAVVKAITVGFVWRFAHHAPVVPGVASGCILWHLDAQTMWPGPLTRQHAVPSLDVERSPLGALSTGHTGLRTAGRVRRDVHPVTEGLKTANVAGLRQPIRSEVHSRHHIVVLALPAGHELRAFVRQRMLRHRVAIGQLARDLTKCFLRPRNVARLALQALDSVVSTCACIPWHQNLAAVMKNTLDGGT
mmetsp:Transcript_58344/g.155954  ORF Transcript_58344/g.155954 Transcript_58344/m.155954 type:complete len:245 (+) Transcript_58344:832-1566(+)